MDNKKLTQAKRRQERRQRFSAGLRDMAAYHPAKALIPLAYLVIVALAWVNRAKVLTPLARGNDLIYHSVSLSLLLVALILLPEIIIALGTPKRSAEIQAALIAAGFVNSARTPPMLFSIRRAKEQGYMYEFDPDNIPLSHWEKDKEKIGAALRCRVVSVKLSPDGKRMLVHGISMRSTLPEMVYWKDEYLSPDSFVLTLGVGLLGNRETINIANTPHILLGGSTGSGKSLLLKLLLMQSLQKGATVYIADFKGGVDYSPAWHRRCKMVFEPQSLLATLEDLTSELERRRKLFFTAGTPNIDEYNETTEANLQRYILACDEVAEVLDTTELNKAEKKLFVQIVRQLSLIARQGRAFGIHLMLATQRPSANLIPGEIRTNLTFRICGRADDILSRIILDSPAAAEQIPPDSKGLFVTNMGQTFKGFLFGDSVLEQ